ncbi:discoidin domain-containing protein [Psychroserpens sp.]|jgi:hypothetical protein|uniref:discoidin domain-containing protein n=1 Tax=Psychroserpens sp. TaxID=2020870 RepID=UPI0039E3546A
MIKLNFSAIFFLLLSLCFKSFSQNPQVLGQWSDPIPFDVVPVAVANLPDGRLLTWSSKYHDDFGGADGFTFTQIFDPSIGLDGAVLPRTVTNTNHDMFCPGINNLADGRILATGGSSSEKATIYNPNTETWISVEDMNIPRGYQGAVTLSDGSAFTIGGSWSGGQGNKDAEIWTEELGWRLLTGLENEILWNTDDFNSEPQGVYRLDNHAWLFAGPNGKIFHAGPGETMHWLDVSGDGSFQVVGNRGDDVLSQNGGAVMFDIGKILKYGGSTTYSQGTVSSDNAYVIDINNENNVTVTPTSNAAEQGRIYTSGVALPNGEVLILGGMETSVPFSDTGAHLSAEMYNPGTNLFTTLASMQIPRTYHSSGILLNDGRVFMGGGGLCGNCGDLNHLDAEIYSPPYLFNTDGDLAVRPSLSAPDATYYERTFPVVASPDVTEFVFMRFSSATHSVNNEQRRVPVTFTGSNGNYQINMPNANLMPPGYYMLFAINADGVPSMSEAVLVGSADSRIMEDNLLVEFDFFEGNGSLINDTSGNSNNGEIKQSDNNGNSVALSNDYWNEDGFSGNAVQMDGMEFNSNTIIEIPSSPTLAALTNQITVMAWVNRDTGSVIPQNGQIPNVSIFAHDYSSFFFGYHNSLYKLEFFTDNGSQASCYVGEYNPGEWEHLVGTYDGNVAKLYVNGQEICSRAVTGNLLINTQDPVYDTFTLSGFYDSRPLPVVAYGNSSGITDELDGSMDKFKLYNVALTAEDVQNIYNNEKEEVEIDLEDNLALNKPTSQSSLYPNGESFKAVDGNTNSDFNANPNSVTHTAANDTSSWWRVDLGDEYEYDLTTIRIYNRDNFAERLTGAIVYRGNIDSTNPADYIEVGDLTANATQVLTQNLGIARYVMIRQDGILSLAEVQVFGQLTNCPVQGTPCDDGDSNTSNDIESGDCSCAGTIMSCENLEIVYDINGESGTGETDLFVSVGDDIGLSLNLQDVAYTVTAPDGSVVPGNVINDIAISQSGLYSVNSIINTAPQAQADPTLLFVSDEHPTGDNDGLNAVDGNNNTFWHSDYSTNPDSAHPHEIALDLGNNSFISGIEYLPRQAGVNGRIANYEIYVSNSTTNWGVPVSTGAWPNNNNLQTVNFTPVQAKYVRLVALSEVNGQPWTSIAELRVIRPVATVFYVDSEELAGPNNSATNAIDGNPNTIWHTQYSDVDPDTPYPHEIHIDLGIESDISGLEYLPRQAGINGTIANYEIYVSNDPNNWGTAVNTGTWANSNTLKTVTFPETIGRYVRLLALSEVNGNAWASAAEINIVRTVSTLCTKTIQINVDTVTIYTYNNTGWSPGDPNDQANFNDDIIIEEGEAVFSMNTTCHNITVNPGTALKVNNGVTLTTAATTLNSTSQLYSSLIVDGNIEGVLKYERYVNANSGGNDLVSPPLSGQTLESFLDSDTNSDDILNDGNTNPRTYLFGPFDKNEDSYVNYTDAVVTTLESGTGYRAGTVTGTHLTFTGAMPVGPFNVNIIVQGATFPEWNLIGNPYPSYLDMNLFLNYVLDANTVPETTNLSILENISGIYGYVGNATSNKWGVITLANASNKLMTPGQGFLVAANSTYVADYDIVFDESMRAIGDDDDFITGRNAGLTFLKLNASTSDKDYTTEFYFNDNASLGLDLGYDGKILGNTVPNFVIYSHLVEDNAGLPIVLQALNPSDLTNTIVPLGVNANQGEQITFSISESTIPSNIEVYLEDTVTNTITLLNSSDYILTPNTNLSGTGRFYLRYESTTLTVDHNELDYLQIYTTINPKSLIIKGELNDAALVHLYDVQGRLVLNKKLNQFDVSNIIDIAIIGTGVYIVKIFNESQNKTQKIIIK